MFSQTKTENLDISTISSNKELEKFINQKFPEGDPFFYKNNPNYSDSVCYRIYDSIKATSWFKIDVDHNGKLDLIFTDNSDLVSIYCVIDEGNGKYSLNTIPRRFFEPCNFVRKKNVGAKEFLNSFILFNLISLS
ncbi:MAG: hypothetical protein IPJ32_13115 [Sphingobacteriaceae bacterium]|nr:hypothetical protein [Sphingobacteriaceae bacterium]